MYRNESAKKFTKKCANYTFFCSSRCHQRLVLHDFIFSFLLEEIIRMSTRAWLFALAKNLYIISYSPLESGHLVG